MDTTAFFVIITILVAAVLIAAGIYLILVLNEARTSLRRLNNILNHADSLLEIVDSKIARPASSFLAILELAKEALEIFRGFSQKRKEPEHGSSQP
jgi:signal transduction histidine kinase